VYAHLTSQFNHESTLQFDFLIRMVKSQRASLTCFLKENGCCWCGSARDRGLEDWLEERFSDEDKKLNGRQIRNLLSFATELAQAKKKKLL
jgi:hypothetical protein